MNGISENTRAFLIFVFNAYREALARGNAASYFVDIDEDEMLIDNLLYRLDTNSWTSIISEEDKSFIQHVLLTHNKEITLGYSSLFENDISAEEQQMLRAMTEVTSVFEAHKGRWMLYEGYSGDYKVIPYINVYDENHNLFLGLEAFDPELGGLDYFTSITTNIVPLPYLHAAIDTNKNHENVLNFLNKNKLGKLTGRFVANGYCYYPVFVFNEEKLCEIDPEGFSNYARLYNKQPSTEKHVQFTNPGTEKELDRNL